MTLDGIVDRRDETRTLQVSPLTPLLGHRHWPILRLCPLHLPLCTPQHVSHLASTQKRVGANYTACMLARAFLSLSGSKKQLAKLASGLVVAANSSASAQGLHNSEFALPSFLQLSSFASRGHLREKQTMVRYWKCQAFFLYLGSSTAKRSLLCDRPVAEACWCRSWNAGMQRSLCVQSN